MSVRTTLLLYTNDSTLNLEQIASELQSVLGISTAEWLTMDSECEKCESDENSFENIVLSKQSLGKYVKASGNLYLCADFASAVDRIERIQRQNVLESTRSDFIIDRMFLQVGHGLLDLPGGTKPFRICICFWGALTPPDCAAFQLQLLASPLFHEFRGDIERVTGALTPRLLFG